MTDSEAVMNLLRKVPLFANLKDEDKVCIEETEEWRLPAGEMLVEEGKHAEYFFVLLEGEISISKKHGNQEIVVRRARPGAFFGEVPLLLGTPYLLSARAECDCRLLVFPDEAFWKLLRLCPAISGEIFRAMVTRLRNIEGSARQQEKLEALGTMSAGLAHELNNPSSAAQRIAVHLGEVIQTIQSVAHRLHHALEHEQWDRLIALVGEVLKNPSAGKHHHSIEQSDSEDALTAWLREGGVTDAWKIAPVLVGAGLEMSALLPLCDLPPKNAFDDAMRWIVLRMRSRARLSERTRAGVGQPTR
jgi:CRP-like cAMP-binding protein